METDSRLSTWARRAVVIAASLATVATSQAKWHVAATVPPPLPAGPKGTLVTIEASHDPYVSRRHTGKTDWIGTGREERPAWAGSGTYYLPPGFELSEVSIGGGCSGGLCDKCVAPPGAFVRVVKQEPVPAWSISVTSAEQTARVDSSSPAVFSVTLETTRVAGVEVSATGGEGARFKEPSVWPSGGDPPLRPSFQVRWEAAEEKPAAPLAVRWVAKATIHGFCRGEGECKPPAEEHVRIESIK